MAGFGGKSYDILAFLGLDDSGFNTSLEKSEKKAKDVGKTLDKVMNATILAGAAAFTAAVGAATQFESSFAGVTKTVDGLRDPMGNLNAEGEALAGKFRDLALEIPISVNELNKIGELGGQLGIPKADLIDFTDTIAKIGVTTNLSIEQAATEFARFVNITRPPANASKNVADQIGAIGSTIVELGNNFATTEAEISEMAQRLAGAGTQIGLTQDDILGISTALTSVGINAEAGGTSFSKLFMKLAEVTEKGGDKLNGFARVAGMSAGDFKTAFEDDAAKAITAFIAGLGNIVDTGGNTFGVMDELNISGIRLRDSVSRAAGAHELFANSITMARSAYVENNALAAEAAQRFATFESQMVLVKNVFYDAFIEIGNNFLPVLSDVLGVFTEYPEVTKSVIKMAAELAVGFGGLFAVIKGGKSVINGVNAALTVFKAHPALLIISGVIAGLVAVKTAIDGAAAAELDAIGKTTEQSTELQSLINKHESLAGKINLTTEEQVQLDTLNSQITQAFKDQGLEIDTTAGNFQTYLDKMNKLKHQKLIDDLSSVNTEIEDLNKQLVEQTAERADDNWINKAYNSVAGAVGDWTGLGETLETQLEKAKEKQRLLNEELGEFSSNIQGIVTDTPELKTQIDNITESNKKLIDKSKQVNINFDTFKTIAKNSTSHLKNYNDKIHDIVEKSKDMSWNQGIVNGLFVQSAEYMTTFNSAQEAYADVLNVLKDPQQEHINKLKNALDLYDLTPKQVDQVNQAIDKLSGKTGLTTEKIAGYGEQLFDASMTLGLFGDKNSKTVRTVGVLQGAIGSLLKGGFDPLSLGISVVTGLFGIFGQEAEEKVYRTMDEVKAIVKEAGIEIEKFQDVINSFSFDSSMLDFYNQKIEKIYSSMQTASEGMLKIYEQRLQALEGNLEQYLDFFTVEDEVQNSIESLQYFNDKANEILSDWGNIDTAGFRGLLSEQIGVAMEDLAGLDPASNKYNEFITQIYDAKKKLYELEKSASAEDVLNLENIYTFDISDLQQSVADWTEYLKYLDSEQGQSQRKTELLMSMAAMKEAGELTQELFQELSTTNNILLQNQVSVTMQEVDAFLDQQAVLNDTIEETTEAVEEINKDIEAFTINAKDLNNVMGDVGKEIVNVQDELSELEKRAKDNEDNFIQFGGAAYEEMNELKTLLSDINEDKSGFIWIVNELERITGDNVLAGGMDAAIEAINKMLYWGETDTKALKEVNATIFQTLDFMSQLNKDSQGYADTEKTLGNLLDKLAELQGGYPEIPASNAFEYLIQKVENLNEELTVVGQEIAIAESNLTKLRNSAQENGETLNKKLNAALKDTNKEISALSLLLLDVEVGQVGSFDLLANQLEDITGKSYKLTVTWNDMLKTILQDFTEFEQEVKEINQVLYFGLTDETAFDQINATIFRMQDYIASLNPNSEAFTDAKTALDELIGKFKSLGGELSEEKALQFNMDQIENAITDTKTEYQNLADEFDENKLAVELEILTAEDNLKLLKSQYEGLQAAIAINEMQIKFNITPAVNEIDTVEEKLQYLMDLDILDEGRALQFVTDLAEQSLADVESEYNQLVTEFETNKAQIDADILAAENKLTELNTMYNDLLKLAEDNEIKIDADTSGAVSAIKSLQNRINDLTGGINIPVGDTMHNGGIVRAHTGLLANDEVPAILQQGEMVMRKPVVSQFTDSSWYNFNSSGNPGNLQRKDGQSGTAINVQVFNPGADTRVVVDDQEVIDRNIYPRFLVNETNRKRSVFS